MQYIINQSLGSLKKFKYSLLCLGELPCHHRPACLSQACPHIIRGTLCASLIALARFHPLHVQIVGLRHDFSVLFFVLSCVHRWILCRCPYGFLLYWGGIYIVFFMVKLCKRWPKRIFISVTCFKWLDGMTRWCVVKSELVYQAWLCCIISRSSLWMMPIQERTYLGACIAISIFFLKG